ncbi:CHY_and RING-type zinc-finger domain-containing protein [Hexamita inflata]|uniref:CHY and RING-type zinc-finger domain-containing protein n=1 Tax=Hexamita inflata TaxID=28002 RepID=A0AA86TV65_9EUKA|nr:CHY and RING-type zinc-finger domain-containing protein [Hexamita inflata]
MNTYYSQFGLIINLATGKQLAKGRMKVEDQETTELRELVEAYFLIKEVDESIGFTALNLVHTRQFKGELREILTEVAKTCAEVREVRRLGIE